MFRSSSKIKATTASVPTALAFDKEHDEVVIVERSEAGEFQIKRVALSESRAVNITAREILTNVTGWSTHTDRSPIPIPTDADDQTVLKRIIDAASTASGSDDLRYTFSRTPNGQVVLTQAHLSHVIETISQVTAWLEKQQTDLIGESVHRIRLETNARLIARLWLDGPVKRPQLDDSSTVVFLSIGTDGSAVGLWSAKSGFVYETEERFRADAAVDQIAWHIHNNLLKLIGTSSLNKLGLEPVSHLVLSCVPGIRGDLMTHFTEASQLRSIQLETLLFDKQNFDDETSYSELDYPTALAMGAIVETSRIPSVDLGSDLQTKLRELTEAENDRTTAQQKGERTKAALAIIAPFVAIIVFLLTSWFLRSSELENLRRKKSDDQQTLALLKQENSDFEAAKANFAVIIGLNNQIATLRDKQAGSYRLMADLNARWPQDPTWQIAEVNAKGANIEIKGKTKNEQAITAFTRALENSEGLFSNITVTNNVPNVQTASVPGTEPVTSSVRDFTIKTTYSQLTSAGSAGAMKQNPAQPLQQPIPINPSTAAASAPPQALLADPKAQR